MSTTIFALSTGTTILVLVVALLVVALVMTAIAMWLVRSTRRDAPALGPLEVMADRSWRRANPEERLAILARARAEGALAPAPMLADDLEDEVQGDVEPEPAVDEPPVAASAASEAGEEITVDVEEIEVEVLHRYHPDNG